MNENIDLVKILDGCPLGTKLYSPLFGEVTFAGVNTNGFIGVYTRDHNPQIFESNGKYRFDNNSSSSECDIFPSKYQRDWNKFVRFWDNPKVCAIKKAKNMRQFNLKEYLKNPRKVVTRDGRNVKIICTNFDSEKYPIIGEIKGYGYPAIYDEEGNAPCSDYDNSTDLFFVPEKNEGWVNIYKEFETNSTYVGRICNSEEEAKKKIDINGIYLATVKIEWEE